MAENKTLIKSLKQKQYTAIVKSQEYRTLLTGMCRRISRKAKIAPNEATIESYFDCELFAFFRDVFEPLGFEYNPTKEASVSTRRHVTKGRADTAIGALVVEFKQISNNKKDEYKLLAMAKFLTTFRRMVKEINNLQTLNLLKFEFKSKKLIIHTDDFFKIETFLKGIEDIQKAKKENIMKRYGKKGD